MKRLDDTEKLLMQCEKDLERMEQIRKEMKQIESNRKELQAYYDNHYLKDYNAFGKKGKRYKCLNQDSIWNVLTDQYNTKIKLLKVLIKSI